MGIQTSEAVFEFYRYTPSIAAAIVFILLFSATTALHIYQIARTRTWNFLPLAFGGFCTSKHFLPFENIDYNS
jgi:hypothetical protein